MPAVIWQQCSIETAASRGILLLSGGTCLHESKGTDKNPKRLGPDYQCFDRSGGLYNGVVSFMDRFLWGVSGVFSQCGALGDDRLFHHR